ncbi:hypothetical protein SADUNF_Sadunf13G0101200 [Salix dunnii]|uniref:Uncharacterized protein n=1 Tax=Salix dunnii TaxID=1413687 RepID=A0A835JPI3_9ROSI|nr:hypothetical protein SADUNF_Sadunf13G0101200 [Salix dunnii]
MAHSLTITPATTARPVAAKSKKTSPVPSLGFQRARACHGDSISFSDNKLVHRRWTIALGLAGALMGVNFGGWNANAAAKRPPPPPPREKKDPSISGWILEFLSNLPVALISTATGMSNLMRPKRSALTLVQRQTAASRSTRPSMRLQKWLSLFHRLDFLPRYLGFPWQSQELTQVNNRMLRDRKREVEASSLEAMLSSKMQAILMA